MEIEIVSARSYSPGSAFTSETCASGSGPSVKPGCRTRAVGMPVAAVIASRMTWTASV
nr:MAG TPA: hypothetical protein [Caudoviricetes sp.]